MNQPLPSYPDYKPSGQPWLAEVPAHWEIKRNKYLFRERDARSQTGAEELLTVSQYTGITKRADRRKHAEELLTTAASLIGYKLVDQDDLVINIMLAWNGSLGISDFNGIVSPAYCVYKPTSKNDPRYFHYLFRSPLYKAMYKAVSTGVVDSRLRLYSDKFFALPALLPPRPEQLRIVAFLDSKTRQIARLLRNKRQLIKLLTEQKQALIYRAVTQGLDADAPRKESGVVWLGDVPAHWGITKLRRACLLFRDGTHQPPLRVDEGYPLLSVRNIINGKLVNRSDDSKISEADFSILNKSFEVKKGDILLAIIGATLGKVAIVEDMPPFAIQRSLAILRPNPKKMVGEYMKLLFESSQFKTLLWENVGFSAQPGIYLGTLSDFKIPFPPIQEQVAIVASAQKSILPIDEAIARAKREIELIQEYRTRLIADVVTGRVDVRHLADAASGLELPAEDELELDDEESEEEILAETEDGRE